MAGLADFAHGGSGEDLEGVSPWREVLGLDFRFHLGCRFPRRELGAEEDAHPNTEGSETGNERRREGKE